MMLHDIPGYKHVSTTLAMFTTLEDRISHQEEFQFLKTCNPNFKKNTRLALILT